MIISLEKNFTLKTFFEALEFSEQTKSSIKLSKKIISNLKQSRKVLDKYVTKGNQVYGINTGLGSNVVNRIPKEEIEKFQEKIIEGRSVAVGHALNEKIGRMVLFSRCIQCYKGKAGISFEMFKYMIELFESGLSPVISKYGSIGASDLVQNSDFALSLIGKGEMWYKSERISSFKAINKIKISIPALKSKDAMVLINHSGLSIALSAEAINNQKKTLEMFQLVNLMSLEAFGANADIFISEINQIRKSPGQYRFSKWFRDLLLSIPRKPRRLQDPLSFRTVAVLLGNSNYFFNEAKRHWENELNGLTDSPVILSDNTIKSTPNFYNPALAISIESLALVNAMIANSCVQRMQRIMDPELSGLPKNLSNDDVNSAGLVASQKTAAAILAEIKSLAQPISFDSISVSNGVEDMGPMNASAAQKLIKQIKLVKLVLGIEYIVASQAVNIRLETSYSERNFSDLTKILLKKIRKSIDKISEDRPIGKEIEKAAIILEDCIYDKAIRKTLEVGKNINF